MKMALLVFLLAPFANGDELIVQFEDIPAIVKERNEHAQGAHLLQQSAEEGRGTLLRSYLPRINAHVGHENSKTGSQRNRAEPFGSIGAKVNVFRGGKDRLEDQAAESKIRRATAEYSVAVREEIRRARDAYWHVTSQKEVSRLLQEAIVENKKNMDAARARIRAGAGTETDRIGFEMREIELAQDLARLLLAIENTGRNLAVLLGYAENDYIQTMNEVGHEHKDELLAMKFVVEQSPVIRSLNLKSEEASLKARQFGRWWTPSLDVFASYSLHPFRDREFLQESERQESVIGVQLSLELFDGMTSRMERRQKALEGSGLQKEAMQSVKELKAKVEGARSELKLTHELIHQSEEALRRSKMYLSRTLDEYRRGVKNSPDVLSASERHFAMRRRFAELRRDYQLARNELLEILEN